MDALSEAIRRLLRRQEELQQRVARIEAALAIAPAETAAPPPEPVPVPAVPPEPEPQLVEAPAVPGPTPSRDLETRVGLAWLNRIGAVTLVLFVAFLFKLAVDNEWIGEAGRVMLGVAAGLAGVALGDRLWKRGQLVYAQGITGASAAVLYLSFYASFGFYQLVPATLAFALMAAAVAMAGALALRYDAPAIAALALLGGYATPPLLYTGTDRPVAFLSYLLLLALGGVAVARVRRWARIEWLALAGAVLLYGGWLQNLTDSKLLVAGIFLFLLHAVFLTSERWQIAAIAQFLATLAAAQIWEDRLAGYAFSALLLAILGLAAADVRSWPRLATAAFSGFWLASLQWMNSLPDGRNPEPLAALLTAGAVLFFAWTPWRLLVRAQVPSDDLLLLALNGAFYFGSVYRLLSAGYAAWMGLLAVAVAAAHVAMAWRIWETRREDAGARRAVVLALGVALTLLTLAAPIQFQGYRVTMVWAAEAAAFAWLAVRLNSRPAQWVSLGLFLVTLVRLLAVDTDMYGGSQAFILLANARMLTFAVAAAALFAAAWWFRTGWTALAPYLAGHWALLWGLSLEALAWASRRAPAGDLRNLQSVSVSALFAFYGAVLVAGGVATGTAPNRFLGLGLLGFVILKLYLFDVWQFAMLYRVAAFGILAVLLLSTSYLYSRYGSSLGAWLRHEKSDS